MSSFYAEPPKTKREQEREEARQKRQDDKRHKKERKEMERKALEGVMSLGYSKEEAKEKLNEIFNEWAKQFRKAIKEENAKLRRRPISKNMTSQALAKRREGR